jgi:transcriptional regulator with XRE-family HTH domain
MTLKELIHTKNLSNTRVAEILGCTRDVVQNYLNGRTPIPDHVIYQIEHTPLNPSAHVTRRELVELLDRLGLDHDDAARCLSKHHDRMERWADPARSYEQRVPITYGDLKRIEQAAV